MQSADNKPKRVLLIGDPDGAILVRWQAFFLACGYIIEHKTLSDICHERDQETVIVLDSVGLQQEFPAAPVLQLQQPPLPSCVSPETLFGVPRSKGDRHRNRRYRWC